MPSMFVTRCIFENVQSPDKMLHKSTTWSLLLISNVVFVCYAEHLHDDYDVHNGHTNTHFVPKEVHVQQLQAVRPKKLAKSTKIASRALASKGSLGRKAKGKSVTAKPENLSNDDDDGVHNHAPQHKPPTKHQAKSLVRYLESIDKKYSLAVHDILVHEYAQAVGQTVDEDELATAYKTKHDLTQNIQETLQSDFSFWRDLRNLPLRREAQEWVKMGHGNFTKDQLHRFNEIEEELRRGFYSAAVCSYEDKENCDCDSPHRTRCVLALDPEINKILMTLRDPDELEYYWTAWHDAVTHNVRAAQYAEFIRLSNQQAIAVGFSGNADLWASDYNTLLPDYSEAELRIKIMEIWEQLRPYYNILHAYVRMKLSQYLPYKGLIKRCGYIPLHLLNNVFGQTWVNVESITKPYPDAPSVDATDEMKKQNYTVTKMMKTAEEAFVRIGLKPLPASFWKNSVLEKKPGSKMECHPTAWDLALGKYGWDYRVLMCASVNQRDLVTMHHELGHVQYMLQTGHLRYALRGSANPGFDESIGDVMSMAVNTPEHLQCFLGLNLGLQDLCKKGPKNYTVSHTDINFLYLQALETIAFLPFSVIMDSYRELIMNDKINLEEFNDKWWEMRRDIQGVIPPGERPEQAFDPAAKYHTVTHKSYFRYFLSSIVQFQLYEGLCQASGQYNRDDPKGKPLYRCDFLQSKAAGKLLGDMLRTGKSVPWPVLLKKISGYENFDGGPLLRYFQPLFDKLKQLLKEGKEEDCLQRSWAESDLYTLL